MYSSYQNDWTAATATNYVADDDSEYSFKQFNQKQQQQQQQHQYYGSNYYSGYQQPVSKQPNRNSLSPNSNYSYSESFSSLSSISPSASLNETTNGDLSGNLHINTSTSSYYGYSNQEKPMNSYNRYAYSSSPVSIYSASTGQQQQQQQQHLLQPGYNNYTTYNQKLYQQQQQQQQQQYQRNFSNNYNNNQEEFSSQSNDLHSTAPCSKSGNLAKDFETVILPLLNAELDSKSHDVNGKRRGRTSFTIEQRRYLLSIFERSPYPSKELLEVIAKELCVTPSIIQTWFKNTRSKQKKLTHTKNL